MSENGKCKYCGLPIETGHMAETCRNALYVDLVNLRAENERLQRERDAREEVLHAEIKSLTERNSQVKKTNQTLELYRKNDKDAWTMQCAELTRLQRERDAWEMTALIGKDGDEKEQTILMFAAMKAALETEQGEKGSE